MHSTGVIESFFLIFAGAALVASAALYTRQPLLVAYIIVGAVLGPHGLKLVSDPDLLSEIAEIGIIFLLFLVGLDLPPNKLKNMAGKGALAAALTTAVFFGIGYSVMLAFGFSNIEALITGMACTFSSTILGIKLLPTTVLHHRHVGEIVVALLLIQDLIAILGLILLASYGGSWTDTAQSLGTALLALPVLTLVAVFGVRLVLLPLITRFDAFNEFIFLLALGWCLGLASVASFFGLSFRDRRLRGRRVAGDQPDLPVHRRSAAAAEGFFPGAVLLHRWRRDRRGAADGGVPADPVPGARPDRSEAADLRAGIAHAEVSRQASAGRWVTGWVR